MEKHYSVEAHWRKIKCPFFRSDNFNSVNCEGSVEQSSVRQVFKTKQKKDEWERKYCMLIDEYANCPIYELANKKYL
ncbi:MAG: hypothetical protein IJ731_01655 [Eubacterium sp.]|nr:hypothetical protein [Eubacterium sp.]